MKKLLQLFLSILVLGIPGDPEPEPKPDEDEKTPEMLEIERLMAELDEKVDREEYEKLEKKYKKLLKDYTSRRPTTKKEEVVLRSAKEIAKEFFDIEHGTISNREYIAKALEYRDSFLREFGTDVFTDFGPDGPGKPTPATTRVVKGLKFLLDTYKSDSLFNNQLQEFLKDDLQMLRKLAKNKK